MINRINWGLGIDEYIEPSYDTIHGKKTGMVIGISANPTCFFYPLRLDTEIYCFYVEVEVYL